MLVLSNDYNASDRKKLRLVKSFILIFSICYCFFRFALIEVYNLLLGFSLTATLPLLFTIIAVPTIFIYHFKQEYKTLLNIKVTPFHW